MSKHPSLDVVIADKLRKKILTGALPLGAHLIEAEHVKEFDVSHGTVRSALKRLEYEGLVESIPRRGVFVVEIHPNDALELSTLRDSLESLAAKRAASTASPQEMKKLKGILEKMQHEVMRDNRKECAALDLEFHRHIVACAHHSRLTAMYAQLASQTEMFINLTDPLHDDLEHMVPLHEPIVRAIETQDAELAFRLSADHNRRDGELLAEQISTRGST
jgi:DNA-binding GntR family transcriptional regulator